MYNKLKSITLIISSNTFDSILVGVYRSFFPDLLTVRYDGIRKTYQTEGIHLLGIQSPDLLRMVSWKLNTFSEVMKDTPIILWRSVIGSLGIHGASISEKQQTPPQGSEDLETTRERQGETVRSVLNIHVCLGLNSHYFHIIGDKLINPIVGVEIPIIRIPSLKVRFFPSPKKCDFWPWHTW